MAEKYMTQVWVVWETHERLDVRRRFRRRDGKVWNLHEVIGELNAFSKERSRVLKKAELQFY
jgi:hypothetical protein